MRKHTILFLAANPGETVRLALDEEARAIQVELERSSARDCFELVTRWAVRPLDLLRELRKLNPTVVHFRGHSGRSTAREHRPGQAPPRDEVVELEPDSGEHEQGLYFQGPHGGAQLVSTAALRDTFGAAGASVMLVVLSGCYSEAQAEALLAHVDCVVGTSRSIGDAAARSFAIGFYGGLGERESIATAYMQGCAAISLDGLGDGDRPRLKVRTEVDAGQFVLVADLQASRTVASPLDNKHPPHRELAISAVMADVAQRLDEIVRSMIEHARRGDSSCQHLYRIYVVTTRISNTSRELLDILPRLGSSYEATEHLARAHEELRTSVEELGRALAACRHLFRIYNDELWSKLNDILGIKMRRIGEWRDLLTHAAEAMLNNNVLPFAEIETEEQAPDPEHAGEAAPSAVDPAYIAAAVQDGRVRLLQLAAIQDYLAGFIKSQCKFADLFPDVARSEI